jgi:hypothetical protein
VRYVGPCLLAVFCVALVVGCGDGRMNTKGRIVKGGVPFTPPTDDFVRVTFVPMTDDGKPPRNFYIAEYNNETGTFKALAGDLHGIPRGKYRIAVSHERNKKDLFDGIYDYQTSPFVFDIESSSQEIVIDLDNPPK